MVLPPSVKARLPGVHQMSRALSGALAAKATIIGTATGWVVLSLALTLYASAVPATLLLCAGVGVLIVGSLQSHRQLRALRWMARRAQRTGQKDKRLKSIEDRLCSATRQLDAVDAILTENTRKLDHLLSGLRQLDSEAELRSQELTRSTAKAVEGATERLRRTMVREIKTTYHEVEALQNLYAMVSPGCRVPPMRGWAASPDLLLLMVELLRSNRPGLMVECGSGSSTLWSALAVQQFGLDTRVVALEHDTRYAQETQDLLRAHGVDDVAEVRIAPLEPLELAGETWQWYARDGWADLRDIGLLFVDGPPGRTGPQARFPALPLFGERLTEDAMVVLDDVIRSDEQEIVQRWLSAAPGVWEERLPLEKGASVLRRRPDAPARWITVPGSPTHPGQPAPARQTPQLAS